MVKVRVPKIEKCTVQAGGLGFRIPIYTHTNTHMHTQAHILTHAHIYLHMHTYTYTCTHIYLHMHTHTTKKYKWKLKHKFNLHISYDCVCVCVYVCVRAQLFPQMPRVDIFALKVPYSGKLSQEKTFANFANKRGFTKFLFAKSQKE